MSPFVHFRNTVESRAGDWQSVRPPGMWWEPVVFSSPGQVLEGPVTGSAKVCPLDAPSWPGRAGIHVGSEDFFSPCTLISGPRLPGPAC